MDISVHNYIEPARLARLTSLQEKFLKHAMNAFPRAKRIVYSTCSMFPEENERVITNVVKTSRAKWRVQEVKDLLKGQWNNFGSAMYGSMGTRCLYAKPESDLTTGFFLAVLDRDEKDLEKSLRAESDKMDSRNDKNRQHAKNESNGDSKNYAETKKHKNIINDNQYEVITNNNDTVGEIEEVPMRKKKMMEENQVNNLVETFEEHVSMDTEQSVKKKKKKRDRIPDAENGSKMANLAETLNELAVEDAMFDEPVKKKKKKRHGISDTEVENGTNMDNLAETDEPTKKKKKKKDKKDSDINDNVDAMDKCEEYENTEDTIVNELETPVKKKKRKRNKDVQEAENDQLEVTTEMVTDEPKKKKKKKHDKMEIC